MSETQAQAPAQDPNVYRVETLPSGAKATFYRRKGRALMNAQRKADGDASRMSFALLSEVVDINGKAPLMEELEEMDLLDVIKLQEVFGELGKSGPAAKP